ncbi:adenylate cyclase, putative, partial [Ixodes scapularis]
ILVLMITYALVPMPLYIVVAICFSYSIVFEILSAVLIPTLTATVVAVRALLQFCVHLVGLHTRVMTEIGMRNTFFKVGQSLMVRRDLEVEKQLKEKMIHSVMPPKVADWLMATTTEEDDDSATPLEQRKPSTSPRPSQMIFRPFNMHRIENVSILFADIVGFTKMSSNKSAEQLVGLLNDLFGRFDYLCAKLGCEKISTLGDCYYCVSGCPEPRPDHARCCVEMGLGMIRAIGEFDEDTDESVNMRVGVHTGTVLCGIVGTKRFKFDVWSNDVSYANKMESTGKPGRVHISEVTHGFLVDHYHMEEGLPDLIDVSNFFVNLKVLDTYMRQRYRFFSVSIYNGSPVSRAILQCYASAADRKTYFIRGRKVAQQMSSRHSWPHTIGSAETGKTIDTRKISCPSNQPGVSTFDVCLMNSIWDYCDNPGLQPWLLKDAACRRLCISYKCSASVCGVPFGNLARCYKRMFYKSEISISLPQNVITKICFTLKNTLITDKSALQICFACRARLLKADFAVCFCTWHAACIFCSLFLSLKRSLCPLQDGATCLCLSRCCRRLRHYGLITMCPYMSACGSLPIGSIFSNFTCAGVLSTPERTNAFCYVVFVSLLHFSNFTQLNFWLRSMLATCAGVVLALLVGLPACPCPLKDPARNVTQPMVISEHGVELPGVSFHRDSYSCNQSAIYEIVLHVVLNTVLVWLLNREFEISYRLSFHGSAMAARDEQRIQAMKNQADWLLHNIIPRHVAEQLKNTSKYSENHRDAGIIFASIVNFHEMYDESYEGGKEFLRVLNELVGDFDELLSKPVFRNVTKIKTIGSTFMAASGLNPKLRRENPHPFTHLYELMDFALTMQQVIENFNQNLLEFNFVIRIGYCYGDVTAGVIGTTKLYYDIWGDAVNIASRMDSYGVPGRIQVPEHCLQVLQEMYVFEPRGSMYIKGKDNMNVHLLVRKKDKVLYRILP